MTAPRRVLLTTDAVGGVWRYTIDLAGALDERGVACLVLGAGPRPTSAQEAEAAGWRRSELRWTDHALDWNQADEHAQDAAAADIQCQAHDWRADLIHLHMPSQAASMASGIAVVAVAHSCQPTWWYAAGDGPMPAEWHYGLERNRRGLRRADRVLVPTRAHADALCEVYGPLDRLSVVPHAVAPAVKAARDRQSIALAAGRWWDAGKNGKVLDRAAAHISWPVVMAGPVAGPDGSAVKLEHAVSIGEVTNAQLRAKMSEAAIFVSPSRYEPFGLAVLEAAMHGCALVLSDIPTFREIWQDAAIFAAADDLADSVNMVVDDPALERRLAAVAKRVAATFTAERQLARILAAYAQCRVAA